MSSSNSIWLANQTTAMWAHNGIMQLHQGVAL
jgi:hypothetical protein